MSGIIYISLPEAATNKTREFIFVWGVNTSFPPSLVQYLTPDLSKGSVRFAVKPDESQNPHLKWKLKGPLEKQLDGVLLGQTCEGTFS